jgi:hypothetical protein
LVLAWAWIRIEEVGFGPTGMDWNGGSWFCHDWNGLECLKLVLVRLAMDRNGVQLRIA